MYKKRLGKNHISSLRTKKKQRSLFERNALRGAAKPLSIEDVRALKIESFKILKEHIGNVFPVILELVSQGHSLKQIEVLLGFKTKILINMDYLYPKLHERIVAARTVRSDVRLMSEMPTIE